MPVPARRHSKTRTRSRRAHDALKAQNATLCSNCQAPVLSHTACPACGFYKGRQALNVSRMKERLAKRLQKKAFEKSQAAAAPEHDHDHKEEPAKDEKISAPAHEDHSREDASKVKKEVSKGRRFFQRKKPE